MRKMLAVILAALMLPFAMPGQTDNREKALAIAAGSPVEVRLKDKTRLRGRLGPVSDASFELQTVRSGKVETQQIGFDQLRSIKSTSKESFGRSVGKSLLITGIVIVAVVGVVAIIVAATGAFTG